LEYFGDKPFSQITQAEIDAAALALYPSGSAATRNRQVYTPVCAVLHHAGAVIHLRRPRDRGGAVRTAWLWPEQFEALGEEAEKLNPEFAALLVVLTYTGMRLSEALGLTWDNVRLQGGFAYVPDMKNSEPRAARLALAISSASDLYAISWPTGRSMAARQ
jgi:integrase